MTKIKTFTVEGSGQFPYDMLRYDMCWPKSEIYDVPGLMISTPGGLVLGRRRVVLETDNPHAPTRERWESFLWRVVGPGEQREGGSDAERR